MRTAATLATIVMMAITACSPAGGPFDQASASQALTNASTGSVCATLNSSSSPETLRAMAQAELAARGIYRCDGLNIMLVPVPAGTPGTYRREPVAATDYDCDDFSTGASAQRFFLASGGPSSDPHNLDADGDGRACEWRSQSSWILANAPSSGSTNFRTPTYTVQRSSYSRTCYTGPRGGTYTITSGGNRNYSGC